MSKPLHILIVEDSEDDCLLLVRELQKGGYAPVFERVDTSEAMQRALRQRPWDIVVSDYLLPRFSGLAALMLLQESGQDLPFIIVSGNIGEDIAVRAMKAGAHDYIIKGNLARLVPAVERELRDAEIRRERIRTEEQLTQSRQRLFDTLENMNEGFFTLDAEWRFTFINSEAAKLWGKTRVELLGRSLWEVAPNAKGSIFEEQYTKAIRERVPVRFEAVSPLINVWVEVRAHPSEDGLAVYFHNITERKTAFEKIARLTRLYSVLSKVNEAIIRVHEPEDLYREVCRIAVENGSFKMAWIGLVDPATRRVDPVAGYGDSGGYLTNINIYAADVPEGKGPTGRAVSEGKYFICSDIWTDPLMRPWCEKAQGHGFRSSAAFPLRSGTQVIGAFTIYAAMPQFFTGEETTLLASLAEDISFAIATMANERKRKDAEQRTDLTNRLLLLYAQKFSQKEYLDAAIEELRGLSGCRHVGIRVTDVNRNIPYISSVGFGPDFMESESMLSLDTDHCACIRVIAGTPEPHDRPAMTANGSFSLNDSMRYVEGLQKHEKDRFRGVCVQSGFTSIAVIPLRYRDRVLGAIHLADERAGMVPLRTVELLEYLAQLIGEAIHRFGIEDERTRLASALKSSADAVVVTEPLKGVIQYVNSAFEKITGYARDEVVGRTLHLIDSGMHDQAFYEKIRNAVNRDGVWQGILINRKKDGSQYFEDCTISPVRNQSGGLINFVSVKRDVTEKLRLESIAESVNTMNNIGYVFSGVRHEIGNPINSAKMILSVLQHKLATASTEVVGDYLGRALGEIGRVEQLLKNLRNYNLYETPELEDLDLGAFMDKFFPLVAEDFMSKGITVEREAQPGEVWVTADPRALQQALLNVMTNAVDALSGRDNPSITITVMRASGRVRIRVADNGCGMTEKQQRDLFKPFYTSKTHGTGLGLVIVKKMLTKMDGHVEVTSETGRGTVVDLYLPEGRYDAQK